MNLLKAIIVDDEPDSVQLLQLQLQKYCPQIEVMAAFHNSIAALAAIAHHKPDLLFLDIEMPELNGFQLLEKLHPLKFKVIFITAYNQHAIKAFKYNALDYLLKPVNSADLMEAVEKAAMGWMPNSLQLAQFQKQMGGEVLQKFFVSTQTGIEFIAFENIIYAEAHGNCTLLIMKDNASFVVTKTLKDAQELLEERNFFRIHRQYIINLNKVKHFDRVDCILTMENKAQLPVARSQKDKLISYFKGL